MASASAMAGTRSGRTKLVSLEVGDPGGDQGLEQRDLDLGGDRSLVLQPVAQRDITQPDRGRQAESDGGHASASKRCTTPPASAR